MGFRTGRKYAITWCEKAETYLHKDSVKALKCYDEAIKRDPKFAKPWYEKGKIFADAEELPGSYYWAHVISPYITGTPEPKYPDVGQPANKYRETLKLFDKATELDPKFVDAWFAKGDFYFGYVDGEDDALECYDEAIALDPKYEPAWSGKAKVLAKLGKHEEALKCYDEATKSEFFRSGLDEIEMNLAKADALSELAGSQERMLKYYSLAIRQCANELMDRQAKPVTEYHWEKGVKKLEEICSQAIKGLKKYND